MLVKTRKKTRGIIPDRVNGYRARSAPPALQDAKGESAFHSDRMLGKMMAGDSTNETKRQMKDGEKAHI
jgi:hypothetical protein